MKNKKKFQFLFIFLLSFLKKYNHLNKMEKEDLVMVPFYTERHFQERLHGVVLGDLGCLHEQNSLIRDRNKNYAKIKEWNSFLL